MAILRAMSLFSFLRRKPPIVADDEPLELDRDRLFSTDFGARAPSRQKVAEFVRQRLIASLPKAGAEFAMDALDLKDTTALTDLQAPNISDTLFAWFALQTFIGHQTCAIVAQHWLINKACMMPARDAVRHGFDITLPNFDEDDDGEKDSAQEVRDAITEANKRFALQRHMIDFVRKGRIFGIRIALYVVDLGAETMAFYENPFNADAIKPGSYKGIKQVDPYWCLPIFEEGALNDPASLVFYEPTWWQIGGRKYHKTHLRIFKTAEPPDLLRAQYGYGGVPIPQAIMERVYAAERTANEAPQLAMAKRLTVWNTDLSHIMANQEKFAEHMSAMTALRDNFGVKMIDTDDKMQEFDTTLAGLDDLTKGQYEIVAAAAGVPVTKLMGTTPKGFNSSGDYEESSYREELESVQENDLTPFVDRHHELLALSELNGDFAATLVIHHEWRPLNSPDAKEYAEINYDNAQRDDLYVGMGALDAEDVRDRLRRDRDSGYAGISAKVPEPPEDALPPDQIQPGGSPRPTKVAPKKPAAAN